MYINDLNLVYVLMFQPDIKSEIKCMYVYWYGDEQSSIQFITQEDKSV